MRTIPETLAVVALVLVPLGAAAQDQSMQGHDVGAAPKLPDVCETADAPVMPGMEAVSAAPMGEHQRAYMDAMMPTQQPMMHGMMAEDPDVAFACAMIPHHQSAINMARVELQYGDAGPMKELAQKIIEAQQQEIAELTEWLEEQAR